MTTYTFSNLGDAWMAGELDPIYLRKFTPDQALAMATASQSAFDAGNPVRNARLHDAYTWIVRYLTAGGANPFSSSTILDAAGVAQAWAAFDTRAAGRAIAATQTGGTVDVVAPKPMPVPSGPTLGTVVVAAGLAWATSAFWGR